jgi:hypothetical protein
MWVNYIKIELGEIEWDGVEQIGLVEDRVQVESSCECHSGSSGSIKCWETIEWLYNWWPL